ncbi:MAG: VOC family protein, partial [Dehalococcoidia bacterium]|nr:VOC family protein [Dehalococcoidia bacterium]
GYGSCMAAITGIAHVELSVRDLDESSSWYCALLGATEVFRETKDEFGRRDAAIREPETGLMLALTEHREYEGAFQVMRAGLDHLAFSVASADELNAWAAKLDELEVPHSPIRDYGYGLAITFEDPDEIALELFWAKPRAGTT